MNSDPKTPEERDRNEMNGLKKQENDRVKREEHSL
tara:strand:+ start:4159 stop:4263 length:105 start_codon:yes stop_codon:yes gene_type:complete